MKDCCDQWKRARRPGTDLDGIGPAIAVTDEGCILSGDLPSIAFCPWCGDPKTAARRPEEEAPHLEPGTDMDGIGPAIETPEPPPRELPAPATEGGFLRRIVNRTYRPGRPGVAAQELLECGHVVKVLSATGRRTVRLCMKCRLGRRPDV